MVFPLKRLLIYGCALLAFVAMSCNKHSRNGVTRYNTTKQMHKHPTLQKIPRSKSGKEQRYKRKGRRDKVMNKSK